MTRKRSNYRGRWSADKVPFTPLTMAMAGAAPVPDEVRAAANAMRHAALVRFAEGAGTTADMTLFQFVAHLARELGRAGIGIEGMELADRAQAVVDAARSRTDFAAGAQAQPGEYDTLQELVQVVDLQMQSLCLRDYELIQRKAFAAAQRQIAKDTATA